MSLVGSLEDLGLGDILQIISLSGKSGALILRSGDGEGQILFQNGLLRGAFAKDGPTALRDLVASRGLVPQAALDSACEDARGRGIPLSRVLVEQQLLDAEAVDALRRENIQAAVFKMFGWPTGEFSFEVHELDDTGEDLFVTPGINPQFLALESTRRVDEDFQDAGTAEPIFDGEALDAGEPAPQDALLPSGESRALAPVLDEEALQSEPLGPEALAEAAIVEGEPLEAELLPEEEVEAQADALEAVSGDLGEPRARRGAVEDPLRPDRAPAGPVERRRTPPLVVVDRELQVLEWLKTALAPDFPRIHIFQRSDLGLQRIRQYLARAELPVVLLATDAPGDPMTGARDPGEIVARLKRLSPRMPVFLMGEPPAAETARLPLQRKERVKPDRVVQRPVARDLVDPRRGPELDRLAKGLREILRASGSTGGARADHPAAALARLREVSARISDPSSRGAVLREVLSFAAQVFSRVALFMVVEDQAVGIAQVGLPRGGGPDEAGLRHIHLGAREPAWFRTVLERQQPVRAAPADEGDQRLAFMLGNELPDEAWVAPILSAERIVALLYGDNLPGGQPIRDTGALEVLLDSAGMALDRAFLETLAES